MRPRLVIVEPQPSTSGAHRAGILQAAPSRTAGSGTHAAPATAPATAGARGALAWPQSDAWCLLARRGAV